MDFGFGIWDLGFGESEFDGFFETGIWDLKISFGIWTRNLRIWIWNLNLWWNLGFGIWNLGQRMLRQSKIPNPKSKIDISPAS
ncbi:MAG: hypothetical protein IPK58_16615 [Acidobacteria bacterium]|nr:hypothetical protein [Acidobacteriota bacterium]